MLLSLLESGFDKYVLIQLLLSLPIIIFSLSVHEAAHGWVASLLGDPTAKDLGRLTLNPFKHLNLFGFLSMLIAGIGWANPVPINTRNFKNPRWGMALSGIAGPISNFLLAFVSYMLYMLTWFFLLLAGVAEEPHVVLQVLLLFLELTAYLNLSLAIFNLIPVPPFDGSRFLFVLLPSKWYFNVMKYEQYTGIVLIVILMVLSRFGIHPVSMVVEFIMGIMRVIFAIPLNFILILISS